MLIARKINSSFAEKEKRLRFLLNWITMVHSRHLLVLFDRYGINLQRHFKKITATGTASTTIGAGNMGWMAGLSHLVRTWQAGDCQGVMPSGGAPASTPGSTFAAGKLYQEGRIIELSGQSDLSRCPGLRLEKFHCVVEVLVC